MKALASWLTACLSLIWYHVQACANDIRPVAILAKELYLFPPQPHPTNKRQMRKCTNSEMTHSSIKFNLGFNPFCFQRFGHLWSIEVLIDLVERESIGWVTSSFILIPGFICQGFSPSTYGPAVTKRNRFLSLSHAETESWLTPRSLDLMNNCSTLVYPPTERDRDV